VLSPPKSPHPASQKLYRKNTPADPLNRVHWRTKQNLDYAYLMMYSYTKGDYYMQIEDDIITSPNYIRHIKQYINELEGKKLDWFILSFCRLGYIGQVHKCKDLPQMILFLLIFHEDLPCDWLFVYLAQVKYCRRDYGWPECQKQINTFVLQYNVSLFQHMGYFSSLNGKIQLLKDLYFVG